MKKELLLILSLLYISSLFSQEIKLYYEEDEKYISAEYHRFQLSTNTRAFYREIPVVFEFAFIREISIGASIGFMPSRDYTYYHIGENNQVHHLDKMAMTYGVMLKNWMGAEPFEGFYSRLNYLFVNMPDFQHNEYGLAIGGLINLTDLFYIDIAIGFGLRQFLNSIPYENNIFFAGNFDMSFGIKIK